MKIIYKSDDGTEFKIEEECVSYENKNKLLMWDARGNLTNEPRKASYLYIPNEKLVKKFINLCKPRNDEVTDYNGIIENSKGFFAWNSLDGIYESIDPYRAITISKIIQTTFPKVFEEEK